MNRFQIALLHLAPVPGDVAHNRQVVEDAVAKAANLGATWILTPEFCISGYTFADRLGVDWILPQPDPWLLRFCRQVAQLHVTVFLSHPEQDRETRLRYNSVFVIGSGGAILGRHRKVNALRVGSEAWSSPGQAVAPIHVPPVGNVGILICADAYPPDVAASLKEQGARLLVSAAAWAPGLHGPNGEWEQRTRETGLPLLLCNRTGPDRTLDFSAAESIVAKDGQRLLTLRAESSTIFTIAWDLATQTLATPEYQATRL
jgi:predicted amidohydrolase